MKKYVLEACIDSVESARNAAKGGAERLELCSNLVIGGTTPDLSLFEIVREQLDIRIHVLIRPRFGDFLYTDYEFQMICKDVERFRQMGADGVVVGCLKADGTLDTERMKRLREVAGSMHMTLHRAFDVCKDPMEALEQAVETEVQTILTSGQKNTCVEGAPLLRELIERSKGRLDILVAGGVNARVIRRLIGEIGSASFHMSGKAVLDSQMIYRKDGVSMGIPGMGEYEIFRTDEEEIRKAKAVMEELT